MLTSYFVATILVITFLIIAFFSVKLKFSTRFTIPSKYCSTVMGFLKGKSAIAVAREFGGKQRNFTGEHFWARGYAVSTVGFEEAGNTSCIWF